jgi:hypothetical protein
MNTTNIKNIVKEEVTSYINEIGEATTKPYPYKLVNTIKNDWGDGNIDVDETYIIDSRDKGNINALEKSAEDMEDLTELSDSEDIIEVDLEYAPQIKQLNVAFDSIGNIDTYQSTNRFKHFRIMSTLVDMIKKSIERFNKGQNREYPVKNTIKKIAFAGEKEKGPDDNRRENFYLAYIKKQIPDAKVDLDRYGAIIELPERFYSY